MYGRLFVPSGRLDAMYTTRLSSTWQALAAVVSDRKQQTVPSQAVRNRRGELEDNSNILFALQHDRGKYCTEYTWSANDGLWGARFLYNFGKMGEEESSDRQHRREKRVDEEEAMEGGLKGRISAGAEVYFSAREKSGGGTCITHGNRGLLSDLGTVSTALRFSTVPDATPPSIHAEDIGFPSQPPTTITAVLNPMLGHISTAYASRVSRDLAVCSRFNFNVYSYESEWSMGAEWWLRKPRNNQPLMDDVQGVFKARISTNYVSSNSLLMERIPD